MTTYKIYALPSPIASPTKSPHLPALAKKYAALRLEALLISPDAYATSHALESELTQEDWENKIWRRGAVILVCVLEDPNTLTMGGTNGEDYEKALLDKQWVGWTVLLGPIPRSSYEFSAESLGPVTGSDEEETKWQMTGLYTSPYHRGKGLAKMIIRAVTDYAKQHSPPSTQRVRIRIAIKPTNEVVKTLYSRLGFVETERCRGIDAVKSNGDERFVEALRKEYPDKMDLRVVMVMELLESTQKRDG